MIKGTLLDTYVKYMLEAGALAVQISSLWLLRETTFLLPRRVP
jgi:hypothetical protein